MAKEPQQPKGLRFRNRSIASLIELLDASRTDTQIRNSLFKYGLHNRYSGPNKVSKLSEVFYPLVSDDADRGEVERANEFFGEISRELSSSGAWPPPEAKGQKLYASFQQALRLEGLDLVDGQVVPFLSPSIEPEREQGVLEYRLEHWGFTVASNHLNNAADLAAIGKWEPANGEVRNFLEGLCDAIAATISSDAGKAPTRGDARQFLACQGFLNQKESDLLKSLFQVLHGEGGHAGTSSSDDCHRRRLMAVSMANYYLERLDDWINESLR